MYLTQSKPGLPLPVEGSEPSQQHPQEQKQQVQLRPVASSSEARKQ